jgi:hypothetical protein
VICNIDNASAHAVKPQDVTVMDLHHRLGLIAPCATHKLVTNNIVTGLALVNLDEPLECKACIKAKLVCREIAREREGERTTIFGQTCGVQRKSLLWGGKSTLSVSLMIIADGRQFTCWKQRISLKCINPLKHGWQHT